MVKQASMFWNSFLNVSLAVRSTAVVMLDLLPEFEMDSYMLFPGLVELIVPSGMILAYGSLSRPPKSYFTSCSWHMYSDACGMQISTHHKYSSEMIFVDSRSILHCDDIAAFWPSIKRRYAHREGELMFLTKIMSLVMLVWCLWIFFLYFAAYMGQLLD